MFTVRLLVPLCLLAGSMEFSISTDGSEAPTENTARPAAASAQQVEVWEPDYALYQSGRNVYMRHCAMCHGPRGDGNGELAKASEPKPRSFSQGLFKFRSTPWEKLPTDDDLRRTITNGLTGTGMGAFNQLRETEIAGVIEFIKFFSRRWKKEEYFAAPLVFPEPPAWLRSSRTGAEFSAATAKGKVIYGNLCAPCHGSGGNGDGPAAKGLVDSWDQPVAPANLLAPHLRSGDDPESFFRLLTTGMNGTPMISFGESLTPEQRWQVIAFVMSLRKDALK